MVKLQYKEGWDCIDLNPSSAIPKVAFCACEWRNFGLLIKKNTQCLKNISEQSYRRLKLLVKLGF